MQASLRNGLTASQLVTEWSGTIAQLNCNVSLYDVANAKNIPTLADVNRSFSNSTSIEIITEHLKSVLRYAGVDLTNSQLAETALSILSSYWFLNLAELCLFFSQLKNGSRGQFVWGNRVNNQAIMVALHNFCIERYNMIGKIESEKLIEHIQKSYARIDGAACAIVKGIDEIKKIKEKAKSDYSAFRQLFPYIPSNYNANDLWMAYGGNESAIRAIYKKDVPSADVASDDIGRFLCEYNIKLQK